ncbi:D-Ala-D-Ala carboxypeptidase family metallohydrolase [Pseudohoeflea coraliihabitans]|uniref:DUF882 domain-containing protein n=1 Tax=Pseudohoeflea coraliihabitans TaxID=2860393 RepID=A0ABS6WQV4_9HYPH|nr:D-Ala-D-Ala carboxypeptidase family metallohydrolase [Pseudohoeflea sp. DP4N28-3]MBW3098150.1 DUF882 domain-containing protein [Pseudohoeflea sp. DP4N28-3]
MNDTPGSERQTTGASSPARRLVPLVCVLALGGCVSAADTMMVTGSSFAPPQPIASADAAGDSLFPATSDLAATDTGASAASQTTTAMTTDSAMPEGIDARTRGITQSAPARSIGNLFAANAPTVPVPATDPATTSALSSEAVADGYAQPAANSDDAAAPATAEQTPAATDAEPAAADTAETNETEPPVQASALAEPDRQPSIFNRLFNAPTPSDAAARGSNSVAAAPRPQRAQPKAATPSLREDIRVVRADAKNDARRGGLPGVRRLSSLFEIKTGNDEDGENASGVEMASAAGLARLAPNGLHIQTSRVDTSCLKPRLVRLLKKTERHYRRPVVVTSGFRSPKHNRRIGGATNSRHTTCEAADIQIEGVSKWELAKYLRSLPGRGGVGTYCHTKSVHVDVGTSRDWNWRCRRRKK